MNANPKGYTFSIRHALGIITMIAVASALLGVLVRRDAQRRAENARRIEAYNEHASTIADQITATKRIIEQERKRLEPSLDRMDGYPKTCRSGQSHGSSGWKYELKMIGPTSVLVDVVAEAKIVDGELAAITITSDGGDDGKRVVDKLVDVYVENDWHYNVIRQFASMEAVSPPQSEITKP